LTPLPPSFKYESNGKPRKRIITTDKTNMNLYLVILYFCHLNNWKQYLLALFFFI
jgi:hypothetical protein